MWGAPGVRKHIERWVQKGLIDDRTRRALVDEMESQGGGFGLGGVLAVLGALLLGAAIITLIAANWDAIPRIGRVGLVLALIWIGYLGGAWRQSKGDGIFSQVFYLVAGAAFGGGIALVGQMYHLSGDTSDAALVWAIGVIMSLQHCCAPSPCRHWPAVLVCFTFGLLSVSIPGIPHIIYGLRPLMAVVLAATSWWNRSNAGSPCSRLAAAWHHHHLAHQTVRR